MKVLDDDCDDAIDSSINLKLEGMEYEDEDNLTVIMMMLMMLLTPVSS